MPARHGKIARLPVAIREDLNRRLHESQTTGAALVAWLNSLPEVRASLQTHFHNKPIREQNLSEWRQGGYQDWLQQQDRLELTTRLCREAASMAESENVAPTAILDRLTVMHYATTAHEMRHITQGKERWQLMRQICADYTKMRRTELATQRLKYQQTRPPTNSSNLNSSICQPRHPTKSG